MCALFVCTCTFAQNNETTNSNTTDVGVVIDGVKWATRNVGRPGKFVDEPQYGGRHYSLEEACKVCPNGWRLPTKEEFGDLVSTGYEWTNKGMEFANGKLFLPAAGVDYKLNQSVAYAGETGYYWSSTNFAMLFHDNGKMSPSDDRDRALGFSVRCVKE